MRGYWAVHGTLQSRSCRRRGGEGLEEEGKFREKWAGSKASRLSLAPLLEEGKSHELLLDLARRYLARLYAPMLPADEKKKKALIAQLTLQLLKVQKEALDKEKVCTSLVAIELEDPGLQTLYYRMLRGDVHIPSLFEVVTFAADRRVPILFRYAPMKLLEELFGKETARAIEEKEQELVLDRATQKKRLRTQPLTPKEMEEILSKTPSEKKAGARGLLSYRYWPKDLQPVIWKDQKEKITVKYFPHDEEKRKKKHSDVAKETGNRRHR